MPCSDKHFEQVHNIKKYIDTLKYAIYMSDNLDLDLLVKNDMTIPYLDLKKVMHNRDKKILNLVDNFVMNSKLLHNTRLNILIKIIIYYLFFLNLNFNTLKNYQ